MTEGSALPRNHLEADMIHDALEATSFHRSTMRAKLNIAEEGCAITSEMSDIAAGVSDSADCSAAISEEAAAGAEELRASTEQLAESAEDLEAVADSLRSIAAKFVVKEQSALRIAA